VTSFGRWIGAASLLYCGIVMAGDQSRAADEPGTFRLATFSADVTPPLGHRLLTGRRMLAEAVDDPLEARGFVLLPPGEKPLVYVSVDWVEIRNDAHDRWREALAEAAGSVRERVLVSCIHQHDAPLADLEAQRLLEAAGSEGQIIDLGFHERAVRAVAGALKEALPRARRLTHFGAGQAEAKQLGSNRRFLNADGTPNYSRYSAGSGEAAYNAAEGTIDPYVKALSFWDGETPLCVLSVYATHPMSHYGTGRVSSDFPGIARARRQADDADVFQIYASGCSGNVTVGKYNTGATELRPVFADRLYRAMQAAFLETQRQPLERVEFRSTPLRLEPRTSAGFSAADLTAALADRADPRKQEMAAMGLSWRKRADAGYQLDVPVLEFVSADRNPVSSRNRVSDSRVVLLLLPGEIYVEYQLSAQQLRPDDFVVTLGYGECAPGYIPIERAWEEDDQNLRDWCWVAPGMEPRVREALRAALK
jgi:hypothetical protein